MIRALPSTVAGALALLGLVSILAGWSPAGLGPRALAGLSILGALAVAGLETWTRNTDPIR